ncbi:MAG: maleylacetate reductase [Actinomycetota bacterium]|nr:maleylacetate reductase [Actinomycetota bacterium]
MDDFVHEQLPQRVVFGWGRLSELSSEVDRLSRGRIMLVAERSTGSIAERIRHDFGARLIATIPEARPHVPRDQVDAARAQAESCDVDVVVTVGGGSATGLGKAIVLERGSSLLSVPTTYAGSEVTPIYGITDSRQKRTGSDRRVLPTTVLYDPHLTTTLPARVSASSGMNAIAHCVEALYSNAGSPIASTLAEEALRTLRKALPHCVDDPTDPAARSNALYGAYLAGSVLGMTSMAIHHRICHVLGGSFGLPHGDVNAVVLPHALAFNEPAATDAVASIARAMDVIEAAPGLFDFSASLGAPRSLRELGMGAADLESAALLVAHEEFRNPRPVDADDVLNILQAAYDGRRPHGDGKRRAQG